MGNKRRSSLSLAASPIPFGLGLTKPRHFREMFKVLWRNRDNLRHAWRILNHGVCDGCALGTSGLRDWTIEGNHLCLVRLQLLRLNTMGALKAELLGDVAHLRTLSSAQLRDLGRIPFPFRRRRGESGFTRVSWREAMEDLGARWPKQNPQRTACFVTSRGITNEVYYTAQKVWRYLGSNNVDNSARLCHAPSTNGLKSTIGVAATTCSYRDWYAADLIVFLGSNPANDQPVSMKYLAEARRRGARVLLVNTYREPAMERYWVPSDPLSALFGTQMTDRFFLVKLGGDLAFLNAVQKVLLERGAIDKSFIAAHTTGLEALQAALENQSMESLLTQCGTSLQDVHAFADEVQRARCGILVWSMGITQHAHGSDTVRAIANLALSQSWVGREGCGLMPIRGHSGVQGGAEMGAYATCLPGGTPITAESAAHYEALWQFPVGAQPGISCAEALDEAHAGRLDALWCIGGNFLETLPEPLRVADSLARIPLRVHTDIVLTHQMFVEPADTVYILPSRTRYEQDGGGTETSTERRVIYSPQIAGHQIGEAESEWRMLLMLAEAVKPGAAAALQIDDGPSIRRDIARSVPSYAGIENLAKEGDQFQWGGPHLCADGNFPTADGKGHFQVVVPPTLRAHGPTRFALATRRGKQFNSMIQAQRCHITGAERDHVFINVADATRLGLAADDAIELRNATGIFRGRVFLAEVTLGTLQAHWPEVNVLIPHGVRNADSGVPDYNAEVEIVRLAH
ncbi:MAG: formate dehydrogenase [Planctomycetes bacterium]|nr:formate dehydrogenase [Planctomycetota bacterium]